MATPELQPQENCHGMAKYMHNQGNQEFSGEIVFCAQCALANILLSKDGQKSPEEDEKMIPQEYKEFAKKTGLIFSDLALDQTIQLCKLFEKYKEIWEIPSDAPIVHTDATKFKIELKDKKQEPFRHNYWTKDVVKWTIEEKHIQEMAKRRVIQPSNSPHTSPIILVAKANGKVWFCVDYRELNERTKKWSYPIPKINDVLSYLGGSSYFSTLDITEAFRSIPIWEEDNQTGLVTVSSFVLGM